MWPSARACLCPISPFSKDTSHIGFRARPAQHDLILTASHPQRPCFQMRSRPRVPNGHELGERFSAQFTPMWFFPTTLRWSVPSPPLGVPAAEAAGMQAGTQVHVTGLELGQDGGWEWTCSELGRNGVPSTLGATRCPPVA